MVLQSGSYQVVYDAAASRFPAWPIAVVGLIVAAAGVGLGAYLRQRGPLSTSMQTVITSAIIFGVSWALLVGGGLYAQHQQLRDALNEGTFVRVEGVVYDTPPGTRAARDVGSWLVDADGVAHWYRYDRSLLAVGYRRGGPGAGGLRNGARVRIADVGGRIARLEVDRR